MATKESRRPGSTIIPELARHRTCGSVKPHGSLGNMPVMDAATIWAAVGAVGAVAAAGIAAWAARQSHDAATQANAAAGTLAAIERGRRHDELAPEFELKFTDTGGGSANLHVTLAGGALESLDEATFTVLDETGKDHWSGGLPGRLTQKQ